MPLVGPSAVLLALMASGMNGQAFAFHGYLPVKPAARAVALKALDHAIARTGATQLFIETPYRNEAMVDAVLETCSPGNAVLRRRRSHAAERADRQPRRSRRGAAKRAARSRSRPAMFLLGRAAGLNPALAARTYAVSSSGQLLM